MTEHTTTSGAGHNDSTKINERAIQYLRCLESHDFDAAIALCTKNATVWHSDGTGDQSLAENVDGMRQQVGAMKSMHYDITRQFVRPDEVLQQHVVSVEMVDGTRGTVHAAAYFRFNGNLIDRIEEYATFSASV